MRTTLSEIHVNNHLSHLMIVHNVLPLGTGVSLIVMFESPRCRTVIQALQPNLRDDMALKEKEVRQITNQNCSRQLLTSHTAQRAVRRPIERSPTAPNEPLRSAKLHALHGGHVDASASRA